jgi:hypothetical protein
MGHRFVRRPAEAEMGRFTWCVAHALELHAIAFIALAHPSRPRPAPETAALDVLFEPTPDPASTPPDPAPAREPAHIAGPPRRPQDPPHLGSPPAAAASAIALPDVGAPLPVASAAVYPGGLTSSDGTSESYVDALGGGMPGDLSLPARLGGEKHWACTVDGVVRPTGVHFRALVRADGTAERVEAIDGDLDGAVLRGATPCAMREHYIAGRDRSGRPATRWTLPFRVEVLGVVN